MLMLVGEGFERTQVRIGISHRHLQNSPGHLAQH